MPFQSDVLRVHPRDICFISGAPCAGKATVAQALNDFSIRRVERDTPLSEKLLAFVENCSWAEVREHTARQLRDWAFTEWECFFAAEAEGRVIGMASVMKEDYYPLPKLGPWISTVFVSEPYRGQGIAGKLIARANDYLRDLGFEKSYIPSTHMGLYERYGYSYVREITNYGGGVDHLYEKVISS